MSFRLTNTTVNVAFVLAGILYLMAGSAILIPLGKVVSTLVLLILAIIWAIIGGALGFILRDYLLKKAIDQDMEDKQKRF